ncbi:MAG: glycosyltransferase [Flavobacteriales bacterium]|nr:MAG: glycosyltransferase [Flavobacteriales bacterium]
MSDNSTNISLGDKSKELSCCIIIPTYNNCKTLKRVIDGVIQHGLDYPIIIVNDGSTDDTPKILEDYQSKVTLITNPVNQGKGMSLRKAFAKAWEMGFENAITIDSDGQHYPEDIHLFIDAAKQNPGALIMGARNMEQEGVPSKSSFGNKFSNFWFKVETGITLPDTQTGFRLYPLEPISEIKLFTNKFETEIEVIVKLAWKKVQFIPIKIDVLYDADERVTHFRPFKDFTRISILNTYLVTLTLLWHLPIRVINVIKKEAIKSDESNLKKSLSIGFGFFMGIFPIWGFQLLVGIPLAFFFKLNKVLFVAAANISIPPFIPFVIFFSYLFGKPFVNNETQITSFSSLTKESIHLNFVQYFIGAILLAIVAGIVTTGFSLLMFKMFRKGAPVNHGD